MTVVIQKSQDMVIIVRPIFTQSYISTYVKILCTDFHICPVDRTPCFHQKGMDSIPLQGTMPPQPTQCPPPPKKKFSVEGDPVCNVHRDWATTTALLWEFNAPQNFLANRWPKQYLVSALQTLFEPLGVLVVGFSCISTLCLLSTFS